MEALDNFGNQLDMLAEKMASLPGKLNHASGRLERGRLRRKFSNLEHYYNRLLADEEEGRKSYSFAREVGYTLLNPRAGERISRLKEPADVRIIVGNGAVTAVAVSQLARESGMSTRGVVHNLRQQGYTVLGWSQYHKLFCEIAKLVPPYLVGVPVEDTSPTSKA